MDINFQGKTALVTGASQGIGREIAKSLANGGAKVYAVARNELLLKSLQNEVPSIEIIPLDLSHWPTVEQALKTLPKIDLLVNNAAKAILTPLLQLQESEIDDLFTINVKSLIHVTKLVASKLIACDSPGAIVNISSQASMAGLLNHTVYCATKGAVDAFTRAAALELGPHKIRVNSVNPTVIMTDMGRLGWSDPNTADPMKAKIPLGRFGEVQEVVDVVLFLLSEKAGMVNGTCLPIDGGFLAC